MNNTVKRTSCLAFGIWATLVSFYFYQFIARSSFITVLTDEFMQYFNIDSKGLGVLGSCYYWVYTLMQIPAGIIVDRFKMKTVAIISTLICSLGLFILIATQNNVIAGFGEMLIGFGSSFAFILVVKSITQWFPASQLAIMTSISMALGCLGPVIGGPIVAKIVNSFYWVDVIKVFCLVGIGIALLMWFIVKENDELKETQKEEEPSESMFEVLKEILSSSQAWVLALMTMAIYAPLSALGDLWGVSFIKVAYNLDSQEATVANNMLYLGVVIGSPIIAYIANKIRSYKIPMVFGVAGAFVCLSIIVYLPAYVNAIMLFALMFLTGFSCGSMLAYPLAIALFKKSYGATVTGFVNMMSMVSGIILLPTVGGIIHWSANGSSDYTLRDFQYGLTSVLVFLLFGTLLSYFIKDRTPEELH